MTGVLLYGPFIIIAARQHFHGQRAQAIFQPRRSTTQTLDHIRVHPEGKIKREFTLEPRDSSYHLVYSNQKQKLTGMDRMNRIRKEYIHAVMHFVFILSILSIPVNSYPDAAEVFT